MTFSVAYVYMNAEKEDNYTWALTTLRKTEEEYWHCLRQIESKFNEFQKALEYIHENWLNPFKDRFVAAWTDTCMHLGSMTSNRAESAHAKLKRQPRSSQLNFERSWVQASRVERVSRFCFYKGFECNCVRVRKLTLETDGVDALSCGCATRRTHQLPCAHEIAEYRERGVPIPLDVVHSHWRKLDLINIGNSSHGTTSPGMMRRRYKST
ncbi:unnamed protein product [Prunus armeniaca]